MARALSITNQPTCPPAPDPRPPTTDFYTSVAKVVAAYLRSTCPYERNKILELTYYLHYYVFWDELSHYSRLLHFPYYTVIWAYRSFNFCHVFVSSSLSISSAQQTSLILHLTSIHLTSLRLDSPHLSSTSHKSDLRIRIRNRLGHGVWKI